MEIPKWQRCCSLVTTFIIPMSSLWPSSNYLLRAFSICQYNDCPHILVDLSEERHKFIWRIYQLKMSKGWFLKIRSLGLNILIQMVVCKPSGGKQIHIWYLSKSLSTCTSVIEGALGPEAADDQSDPRCHTEWYSWGRGLWWQIIVQKICCYTSLAQWRDFVGNPTWEWWRWGWWPLPPWCPPSSLSLCAWFGFRNDPTIVLVFCILDKL